MRSSSHPAPARDLVMSPLQTIAEDHSAPNSKRKFKMRRAIFTALLAAGLAASPAVAQQSQHQHGIGAPAEAQPVQGSMMQGGMMHDSEAMLAHRQKMQEMQALMQRAHAATNPVERQRLMGEHRQMMQAQMVNMMKRMAMMQDMMMQMAADQEVTRAK
jgi:protein CpxP